MNFTVLKSEVPFRGIVFDLRVDTIEYHSGNTGIREVAMHNGGAVVVPVTDSGNIILVKQYRYPLDKWIWELPAGKLGKDEDPLLCAGRELKEETGYSAQKITALGSICTTPGFCTEILYVFLATGLSAGEHSREEGEEGMTMKEFSIQEIFSMIAKGELFDGKSISGITMAYIQMQQQAPEHGG